MNVMKYIPNYIESDLKDRKDKKRTKAVAKRKALPIFGGGFEF